MCGVCITFCESDGAIFGGYENEPDSCPKCHRLFPLKGARKMSARFECNRQDRHETKDVHWFERGAVKITWQYTEEEISQWIASVSPSVQSQDVCMGDDGVDGVSIIDIIGGTIAMSIPIGMMVYMWLS